MAVSAAAFNTGNNMLYLVLALMLAALISSFMISEYSIRDVHITREAPEYVTEGVSFRIGYIFRNDKRLIPTFVIRITELLENEEVMAVVTYIGAGNEVVVKGAAIAGRRGRVRFQSMTVSTSAPFGWFDKSKRTPLTGELVALPRTDPRGIDMEQIAALGDVRPTYKPGRGDELFGFRNYVRGDPVKDIHWKTSARTGELMVREREAEEERKLRIELGISGPRPVERDVMREAAIRRAGSIAEAAIQDGWQVRIEAGGKGVEFGHGPGHLREILIFLALFDDPERPAGKPLPPTDAPALSIT
jgi:uncharacterized protein (DUF58 family)